MGPRQRRDRDERRRGRGADRIVSVGPEHILEASASCGPRSHRTSTGTGLPCGRPHVELPGDPPACGRRLVCRRAGVAPPRLAAAAARLAHRAHPRGKPRGARRGGGAPGGRDTGDAARGLRLAWPAHRADGFAAMHCDEVLVHGYDIALGLGIAFRHRRTWRGAGVTRCFRGPPRVPLDDAAGCCAAWPCRTTRG